MALEVEWKFAVERMPPVPAGTPSERIEQGYFGGADGPAVRVRIKGAKTTLEVKAEVPGRRGPGAPQVCREFVYAIPAGDAAALLALAPWRVVKTRFALPGGIELDVFEGVHAGLVVAECEVPDGTPAPPPPPGFVWRDVSSDVRYVNRALAENGMPEGAPRCVTL